jgi:CRP-like cAMP-binding protein
MPAEAIKRIEDACEWSRLPPGSVVFRQGEPSYTVHFIVHGTVRIFFRTQNEQEVNYAQFSDGHMFGELAAIDGMERSADVITMTDSLIATCPREVFIEALQTYPQLGYALVLRYAAILRQADQRITSFSTQSPIQRVYQELLRLATPETSGDGTWEISPAPLHKDIAAWAGTTPDVVGRAIGTLMRSNLMRRRMGGLQMLDRRRLEMLATLESDEQSASG